MSKPILPVTVATLDGKTAGVRAVFDTGSFNTIIREDRLPPGSVVERLTTPREFKTAAQGGKLRVVGGLTLVLSIGEKMIEDSALISPDLGQDMLIGAGTMQKWDISIRNRNGKTKVIVGRDMRDPEITEVD